MRKILKNHLIKIKNSITFLNLTFLRQTSSVNLYEFFFCFLFKRVSWFFKVQLLFPEISISVDSPPTTFHKFADISTAPESALPFLLRRVSSLCASGSARRRGRSRAARRTWRRCHEPRQMDIFAVSSTPSTWRKNSEPEVSLHSSDKIQSEW